jgi:hypothetical protein
MHIIVEGADQHDQRAECRHCHWSGSIKELKKGEYLELSRITELFCPECNKYIGFIQHDDETGE